MTCLNRLLQGCTSSVCFNLDMFDTFLQAPGELSAVEIAGLYWVSSLVCLEKERSSWRKEGFLLLPL